MAPNLAKCLAILVVSSVPAQAETVWSSFAFVMYGERTPYRSEVLSSLTPYGAQQLYEQGQFFRSRYLQNLTASNPGNASSDNAPIVGIEGIALDNTQFAVYSDTDSYITGSALAFMQGLYPPATQAFAKNNGGLNSSVLADGDLINYPLDGYQYPNVQTLALYDPNSVWLDGHKACTEYWRSGFDSRMEPGIEQLYYRSSEFYQTLWETKFQGTYPMTMANFDNAIELYEYARYQYNHNETIANSLTRAELLMLAQLAGQLAFEQNGNLTASGQNGGDMIRAIAGRTLIAKVVGQFQEHLSSGGYADKMTLAFGSFEPMIAFFALSGLATGHSAATFQQIPQPGSAIVFELFSVNVPATESPRVDDLWVRFFYRNGTGPDATFLQYPMFNNGNSDSSMKWLDWDAAVDKVAITDVTGWCEACDTNNLFCYALKNGQNNDDDYYGKGNSTGTDKNKSPQSAISPTIAGVVGAAVTLGVMGIVAIVAAVFGGIRLRRDATQPNGSFGGFKGAEKMASDRDISIANGGARHERVGSWELGAKKDSSATLSPTIAGLSRNETSFGVAVFPDDEDDVSMLHGRAPVKPLERI